MWRYCDYLAVSEDFIPVFSEEVDNNNKGSWKFFIPHLQMRNLLEKLIVSLERGRNSDKLSHWLTGAYGTGKTYASFVVKHILEDDIEEIEDYFQKHELITPLWPRIKAIRENKRYLVVYRSAADLLSGSITSNRRLMMEMEQAIKEKLHEQGYSYTVSTGIMHQLLNRLSEKGGIIDWEMAFNKYRGYFPTVASADEVIDRLHNGDLQIAEQVANILEQEGISLHDSPTAMKAWIKDIINENDLQGIIFIWDEFTDYFANNVPVTPLQELAQATVDMPFYLFIVTHKALSQFSRIDDDTRRKLLDRFHTCQLEMTPVTAYKLIANIIEAKAGVEWEAKRDSLWSNVDVAVLHINLLGESVKKEELKLLTPIHPFTAYLLATISSLYSSSQRTLFQFLKKDDPGSFQWFVNNYPRDNWYWLTPDFLWQYFFEDFKIEDIENISDILNHYHTNKGDLNQEELRVFQVMLLLTVLGRQTQGTHALLKPSLSVIKRMFVGTELYHQVNDIAEKLCARGFMHAIPAEDDFEYIIPTVTIDHNKLRRYEERARNSLTFEKMVNLDKTDAEFAPYLKELLYLQGAAKLRYPVKIVSAQELKSRHERIVGFVEQPCEIGLIFVVAEEDEHLYGTEDISSAISKNYPNYCILISQNAFGKRRWNEWIGYRARAWYHEEMRDNNTKRYYESKGKRIVDEWFAAVRIGRIRAFFRGKKQVELVGSEAINEYLNNVAEIVYPYGPEKISRIDTLYVSNWGKAGAEIGLKVAQNIQRPYKTIVDELKEQGLWEEIEVNKYPEHPLIKMKQVVDNFFQEQDHVFLKDLWDALQEPPYGLLPSPIGILIFAYLLRDYAQGYYYSDGYNSLPLNPNKLAEIIEKILKGAKLSEFYTIRKMSKQGEAFCKLAREVFHLDLDQTAYPEETRKNIRKQIMELGYPLWTVRYYVKKNPGFVSMGELDTAIEKLNEIIAYERDELSDEEIQEIVDSLRPIKFDLSRLFGRERMQVGMEHFLYLNSPKLNNFMDILNIGIPRVMSFLRKYLNEDVYLWEEERVKEKLPLVASEFDFVDSLNKLLEVRKKDLQELREHFINWFDCKLPLYFFVEGQNEDIAGAINSLNNLIYHNSKDLKVDAAEDIRRLSGTLRSLLSSGSIPLTKILIEKYSGQTLSEKEAAQVYADIPDLRDSSEDEVKRAILIALSRQAKQKKISEVRRTWQIISDSASPEEWSEKMRTPIQWVIEGLEHHNFIKQYSNISNMSEDELEQMILYLNNNRAELEVLKDSQYILQKLIQVAAGDYADLVYQAEAGLEIQSFVYKQMDGNVFSWPMRMNEINRLVRGWIHDNYKETAYRKVAKMIDLLSPDEIKQILKSIVAEDALMGVRLLAAIKGKDI